MWNSDKSLWNLDNHYGTGKPIYICTVHYTVKQLGALINHCGTQIRNLELEYNTAKPRSGTERNSDPALRTQTKTLGNSDPTQKNSDPTQRNSDPTPRNSDPPLENSETQTLGNSD